MFSVAPKPLRTAILGRLIDIELETQKKIVKEILTDTEFDEIEEDDLAEKYVKKICDRLFE